MIISMQSASHATISVSGNTARLTVLVAAAHSAPREFHQEFLLAEVPEDAEERVEFVRAMIAKLTTPPIASQSVSEAVHALDRALLEADSKS